MKSEVFRGETRHLRLQPVQHSFHYRMYWLCLDLDDLEALDKSVFCFGHNRRALVSIHDADYAGGGPGGIRDRVQALLHRDGIDEPIARVTLLTIPRVLGYVFNPISLFRCYRPDGALAAIVAEVHNTFGETHHYTLRPEHPAVNQEQTFRFRFPKVFYVSPFFAVNGEYEIHLVERENYFSLTVNLHQNEQLVFSAGMSGTSVPLASASLAATLARLPLLAATVMLRIHAQALRLHWRKRLGVFARSNPISPATIPAQRQSFWHRWRERLVSRAYNKQNQPALSKGRS